MKTRIAIAVLAVSLAVSAGHAVKLRRESAEKTRAIASLGALVHECWARDTTAFNENVRNTDAFRQADSVLCGDWEDIFFEW
jgi:Skp family chaperone for outer membrane proteins